METANRKKGFDYYLTRESIEEYQNTPLELRLAWLSRGNLLRSGYSKKLVELQDAFREGKR